MENHDLDAMLQRFTAGDRSLDVLAPLNEAAWDSFHDPWEAKPFFLTGNAEAFLDACLNDARDFWQTARAGLRR